LFGLVCDGKSCTELIFELVSDFKVEAVTVCAYVGNLVGSGGKFAKLENLFEIGRFVEEVWEVCGFGLGDLGGVVVCIF
jgi:hypothetical protein